MLLVNDKTFKEAIKNGIVVIDFMADWCQPCKPVAKHLEELSTEFTNVKFIKINVEESPSAASFFDITNLPTVYVLRNGEYKAGVYGKVTKDALRREINKVA